MKKLTIIASLVAVFGSAGLAQAANTGTINFEGELTANTCDVVVDGQTANATVVLPTISVNQLDAATLTAGDTGFVMALSNCSGTLQTASAYFQSGASVDANTGRLKNLTGDATKVSLQLLDGSSAGAAAVIKAGSQEQVNETIYQNVSGGSANLPYIVRYYAEGEATPGTVVSNVVYSIQYQ